MARLKNHSIVAGRYRIERLLNRGGQADIYVATDEKFEERVALKVATAATPAAYERLRERFKREARIGNRLGRTPGFVRAFDWGVQDDRRLYLGLDLVLGAEPLDLDGGTRAERLRRLRDAARIVAEAHRQGVVHRDLKPENFLQSPDGTLVLTDFGLARFLGERDTLGPGGDGAQSTSARPRLTKTGTWQGTPLYMAPEQFDDMKAADVRADIYALGVMLFYALTGAYPYPRSPRRRQQRVRDGNLRPPRPRDRDPDVTLFLDILCSRATALNRDERLPEAQAFVEALDVALAAEARPVERPAPPTPSQAIPRPVRAATDAAEAPAPPSAPASIPADLRPGDIEFTWRNERDGSLLVWVPPGSFVMGSEAPAAFQNEQPVHKVKLTRGRFMGRTHVTWAQFRAFCGATGHAMPEPRWTVQEDHPVHGVTWAEAQAYCDWAGVRLPTEAEWEWAARGPDGRAYPWGDDPPVDVRELVASGRASRAGGRHRRRVTPPTRCWWIGAGAQSTAAAGSFPAGASPFGCLDMSGNLWTWVQDRHGDYPSNPVVDPVGPASGTHRVCRGGAWGSTAAYLRATARTAVAPTIRYLAIGFRVARDP